MSQAELDAILARVQAKDNHPSVPGAWQWSDPNTCNGDITLYTVICARTMQVRHAPAGNVEYTILPIPVQHHTIMASHVDETDARLPSLTRIMVDVLNLSYGIDAAACPTMLPGTMSAALMRSALTMCWAFQIVLPVDELTPGILDWQFNASFVEEYPASSGEYRLTTAARAALGAANPDAGSEADRPLAAYELSTAVAASSDDDDQGLAFRAWVKGNLCSGDDDEALRRILKWMAQLYRVIDSGSGYVPQAEVK